MRLLAAENGLQLVAAIALAGIILFELRAAVTALNNTERYYTAITLVLCVGRPVHRSVIAVACWR